MGKYDEKIKDIRYKMSYHNCRLENPEFQGKEIPQPSHEIYEEQQLSEILCAIYTLANEVAEVNKKFEKPQKSNRLVEKTCKADELHKPSSTFDEKTFGKIS